MKHKSKSRVPQPRNHLVALVMFRHAGAHRKSNKALRRQENAKKLTHRDEGLIQY